MIFNQEEILEILRKLDYKIVEELEMPSSRKSKIFGKRKKYHVEIDGEKYDPKIIFKREAVKRIFNI